MAYLGLGITLANKVNMTLYHIYDNNYLQLIVEHSAFVIPHSN